MDPFFNIFNFYVLRTHKRISAGKEKAPIMQKKEKSDLNRYLTLSFL